MSSFNLYNNLWGRKCYYFKFIDEETEHNLQNSSEKYICNWLHLAD